MSTSWLITMKPTFQQEWLALPPKEAHQILEKITLLTKDPHPQGSVKKQLTGIDGGLYRLRSGDYRIFYTLAAPYISLLALRRRREDTYEKDLEVEYLGGVNTPLDVFIEQSAVNKPEEIELPEGRAYPEPLTKELLLRLFIPADYHTRLLRTRSEEELYACDGVPDEYKLKIQAHMFEKPLVEVFQEKDYVLADVQDLIRYKQGELLGFLLKLSPEQEKFANWALNANGPTLLKGGPGTGKSTIALYRVRNLVQELREQGQKDFCILFTTYTNALAKSSEQLLEQLLGDDARYVQVKTVDKVVHDILEQAGSVGQQLKANELDELLLNARKQVQFVGKLEQQLIQRHMLERISFDYLLQEIIRVIIGGQLATLEEYQQAERTGRKMPLNKTQRQVVWVVYQEFAQLLKQTGKETWSDARARAERIVARGEVKLQYDAVIIDEAQDLEPCTLRLLTQLCRTAKRLFITADANQSIYGSHFNWTQIHKDLQFRGRTAMLQANYRSTREIGEAAQSYLAQGELDGELVERKYTFYGPLPVVRTVVNEQDEAQLLASFLNAAARTYQMPLDACAILCPNEKVGRALASALRRYDEIEATFMAGQQLNLAQPGVKILTLNSSKGLEFPVVALAGFGKVSKYMNKATQSNEDEKSEYLALERRLLYVGMTRAMRALLVVVPGKSLSPLMSGFDGELWNVGG